MALRASGDGSMSPTRHDLAVGVRDLDADGLPARDRRQDAHVGRRHGVGDVLVEAGDPGDLDAGSELELVAGDRRADHHADQAGLDTVLGQGLLQFATALFDRALVDVLAARSVQHRHRRQLPGRPAGGRSEADVELFRPAAPLAPARVRTFGAACGAVALGLGRRRCRARRDLDRRRSAGRSRSSSWSQTPLVAPPMVMTGVGARGEGVVDRGLGGCVPRPAPIAGRWRANGRSRRRSPRRGAGRRATTHRSGRAHR